MYNFKKFPGVTPPDPQHWLGGEGVKPPSGEILATGLVQTIAFVSSYIPIYIDFRYFFLQITGLKKIAA